MSTLHAIQIDSTIHDVAPHYQTKLSACALPQEQISDVAEAGTSLGYSTPVTVLPTPEVISSFAGLAG
jgi:hypothetical protein